MMKHRTDNEIPLVMLQQACIPHYRQQLFEKLGSDPRFRLIILADPWADVPFLRLSTTQNQYEFEPAKQYVPLRWAFSWQPRAVTRMVQARPDVMIAQGSPYDLTAWVLTIVGRVLGIPVLLWTHGLRGNESWLKWIIRAWLYRLSCGLLLYGDHAKDLLRAKGFSESRLHVVYNSLDDRKQMAVSKQLTARDRDAFRCLLGIEAHERLMCFTGRLQPVKRLPWLLHALQMVVQRGHSVHLALVGDGSEREQLELLTNELGLTRLVHFFGAVYEESSLGLVISASDLAVIPAGAGLSIMHALAYGTPVLLDDKIEEHFPEWEAVKEGDTGWFYCNDDPSDCAQKIIDALYPTPGKAKMAAACQAMIRRRYNTISHARLLTDAIAKHSPLAIAKESGEPLSDAVLRSESFEHSL